jgi:hypothetical protein
LAKNKMAQKISKKSSFGDNNIFNLQKKLDNLLNVLSLFGIAYENDKKEFFWLLIQTADQDEDEVNKLFFSRNSWNEYFPTFFWLFRVLFSSH